MLSHTTTPYQSSSLPRRNDSLASNIAKPKPTSPLVQSKEDAKFARVVLNTVIASPRLDEAERAKQRDDRERELVQMLGRMTDWVEELAILLQQAYKNQTDLETALTLTRSNLQLALANNEMLEEALQRGAGGGKDIGWRRWSDREGVRRSGGVGDYVQREYDSIQDIPPQSQVQQHQSAPSRFFNFKSSLQRISSGNNTPSTSPIRLDSSASVSSLLPSISIPNTRSSSPIATISTPASRNSSPSPPRTRQAHSSPAITSLRESTSIPTVRETELIALLDKERLALKAAADAKIQLEGELENLSQALFEEANRMVAHANRKLAETEEELRIAMEQKEALRSALRIVEGENGALRGRCVAVVGREDHETGRVYTAKESTDQCPKRTEESEASDMGAEAEAHTTGNEGSALDGPALESGSRTCASYVHEDGPETERLQHTPAFRTHVLVASPSNSPELRPTPRLNTSFAIPDVTLTLPTSRSATTSQSFWSPETPDSSSLAAGMTLHPETPALVTDIPSTSSNVTTITYRPDSQLPDSSDFHENTPLDTIVSRQQAHRWSKIPATSSSQNADTK